MMKKRLVAIGDVHGCIHELNLLLEQMKYNPKTDQLIFLGDYVDKGLNPKAVVERVMQLVEEDGAIALGGNHEIIFLNWLDNNDYKRSPYFHRKVGGKRTAASFYPFELETLDDELHAREYISNQFPRHIEFLKNRPDYYETSNHLFVHAGIDPTMNHWSETSSHNFRWIREQFHHKTNDVNKTIVFGHTVTYKLHNIEGSFDAWKYENKIGIDGGCVYGGNLIGLAITGEESIIHYVRKQNLRNEVE